VPGTLFSMAVTSSDARMGDQAPPGTVTAPVVATLPSPSTEVLLIEPRRAGLGNSLREIWRLRRFGYFLGVSFLEKRYGRTVLGALWVPLRPGISLVTKVFVYGGLIGIAMGDLPYSLAFLVGTAAWQLFHEAATWSIRSIQVNRKTVQFIYMPRPLIVLSAVVVTLIEFVVNLFFVAIGLAYYLIAHHHFYLKFGVYSLLAPAGLILMLLLGLGVGVTLAGAGARTRDLQFLLPYVLNLAYFVTPVIYPLSQLPPKYRPFEELNPMTGAVEMVRDGFFHTHTVTPPAALVSVVAVLVLWGPLYWLADRREVKLLTARPEPKLTPEAAR
jgi:lipopolysaccharide transport system permease protein